MGATDCEVCLDECCCAGCSDVCCYYSDEEDGKHTCLSLILCSSFALLVAVDFILGVIARTMGALVRATRTDKARSELMAEADALGVSGHSDFIIARWA